MKIISGFLSKGYNLTLIPYIVETFTSLYKYIPVSERRKNKQTQGKKKSEMYYDYYCSISI